MAVIYSIQIIGGATAAVACRDLTVRRVTGGVSTCTFFVPGPADAAPAWPYGTEVAVLRSGVAAGSERLFRGTVTATRHVADGTSEGVAYTISDAWWHLEREIYKAGRTVIAEGGTSATTLSTPRVLLFRTPDGASKVSAAGTVSAAVAYAATMGVPIQAGTIIAPVEPPPDEVLDRTCAEIILRTMRWQPDAVAWINHATEPPSFNVTRRTGMDAASLAFSGLASAEIQALPDRAVPGVEISFEFTDAPGRTVAIRTAGNPLARGCARMTIQLDHESGMPGPIQEVKVVALGDYTALSWWRAIFPWLPADAVITEPSVSPVVPEGFTNILTAGQVDQWMTDEYGVEAGSYTVSCKAEFLADGHSFTEKILSRSFVLTNAITKRYRGNSQAGWREPIPEDLADDFYASSSLAQYEGSVLVRETECLSGRLLIGGALNITGGLAAWATMAAVVSAVTERFDAGQTEITVGPQTHLGPQDLVELIRASRIRSKVTIQTLADEAEDETEIDPFAPEDQLSDSPGKLSALELIDPEV